MSDVTVEHQVTLTRHEAASWIAGVAAALSGDGPVSIRPARSTVELEVPDHVRCEVEVDADEVEPEFESKWSTVRQAPPPCCIRTAMPRADSPRVFPGDDESRCRRVPPEEGRLPPRRSLAPPSSHRDEGGS